MRGKETKKEHERMEGNERGAKMREKGGREKQKWRSEETGEERSSGRRGNGRRKRKGVKGLFRYFVACKHT